MQAYKGFGLALILDLLVGGLSGGRCCHPHSPPARGNDVLFLVIDPSHFVGGTHQQREAEQLVEYVRATPRAAGVDVILLPGDPERLARKARDQEGIPLQENHWQMLVQLAERIGVSLPNLRTHA
jgi:uncharacterized oxidoreductase